MHFGFDFFGHILGDATLSRGGRFWRGFADVAHATLPEPGIYVGFPGILVVWDLDFPQETHEFLVGQLDFTPGFC